MDQELISLYEIRKCRSVYSEPVTSHARRVMATGVPKLRKRIQLYISGGKLFETKFIELFLFLFSLHPLHCQVTALGNCCSHPCASVTEQYHLVLVMFCSWEGDSETIMNLQRFVHSIHGKHVR